MATNVDKSSDAEKIGAAPSSHSPSLAGSVIEAKDGLGGSNYIRIQNISCTGRLLNLYGLEPI